MGWPQKKHATYQDSLALPENQVGEIIDGDLIASPRPAARHARASSRLGTSLDGPFDRGVGGPGGWLILDEPELHFGREIVVPDLAGWRRERMPTLPDVAAFELAPDWVCEVISPSTAAVDRSRKLPLHARERVAHAWLVDPIAKTLEVLRRAEDRWLLVATHAGEVSIRAEPFDAVALDLGGLWAL